MDSTLVYITAPMLLALRELPLPPDVRVRLVSPDLPQAFLEAVWVIMQHEGTLPAFFWFDQEVPDAQKGDWPRFLHYCRQGLCLAIWYGTTIAGMLWITQIIPGQHAEMSGWYRRSLWRRTQPRAVSRAVTAWAYTALDVRRLWAKTIHQSARGHLRACGARQVAAIPACVWYRQRLWTVYVFRGTPETLAQETIHPTHRQVIYG